MTASDTGAQNPMTCIEVMRLVTEYLEGTLARGEQVRFEAHIHGCDGCDAYIAQMRATIRLTGSISPGDLDETARQRLLEAFRTWTVEERSATGFLDKLRKRFKR